MLNACQVHGPALATHQSDFDLEEFATAVGLPADNTPTIVLTDPAGVPLTYFRGEVSPEGVDEIVAAIEKLLES